MGIPEIRTDRNLSASITRTRACYLRACTRRSSSSLVRFLRGGRGRDPRRRRDFGVDLSTGRPIPGCCVQSRGSPPFPRIIAVQPNVNRLRLLCPPRFPVIPPAESSSPPPPLSLSLFLSLLALCLPVPSHCRLLRVPSGVSISGPFFLSFFLTSRNNARRAAKFPFWR